MRKIRQPLKSEPSHVSYMDFRQRLAAYMHQVWDSQAPLYVTRQGGRSVVVLSEEGFGGWVETVHLLRSPPMPTACWNRLRLPTPASSKRMVSSRRRNEGRLDRAGLARLSLLAAPRRRHVAEDQRPCRGYQRSPFRGFGKPEALKFALAGWWSRRITQEHRLVYRVSGKAGDRLLEIAQCRYHY